MRIAVYTGLFGPTQPTTLPAPPPSIGHTTYICITDQETHFAGWSMQHRQGGLSPQHLARWAKTHPGDTVARVDVSIWLDATFTLLVDPVEIVAAAAKTGAPLVGLVHPDRRRIVEEAHCVMRWHLADSAAVKEQIRDYQAAGFDTDEAPLRQFTTTGLLVRWHTLPVARFNDLWWAHLQRYTLRDQLSIDYCAMLAGIEVGHLPGCYRANAFARYDRTRRTPRHIYAS